MGKLSKRRSSLVKLVDRAKSYGLDDALSLLKETAVARFDESVDVAVNLGIDPRKSDQVVRGSVVLPAGTGRVVRVAVFAQGSKAEEALNAGADLVGLEDLAEKVRSGVLDFDVVVAAPDAMRVVGQLGQILGPRGLMPNPKVGTVSADVATAVKNAKGGQVQYRSDRGGVIHCSIGKASFEPSDLKENFTALLSALVKARPTSVKGSYISSVFLSSTMGVSVRLESTSLLINRV